MIPYEDLCDAIDRWRAHLAGEEVAAAPADPADGYEAAPEPAAGEAYAPEAYAPEAYAAEGVEPESIRQDTTNEIDIDSVDVVDG
jgi:hypothetical protein